MNAAVADAEGEAIRSALGVARGDKHLAATILSVSYHTLRAKMKRYGIPSNVPWLAEPASELLGGGLAVNDESREVITGDRLDLHDG